MKKRMCSSRLLLFTACLFWTFVLEHLFFVAFFKIKCCSEPYITNLKGLYLIVNYTSNPIKTNMDASQEYNRSRKDCPFIPDLGLTCKSTDLSITLLNIQSIRKHTIDISGDVRFPTDILSFTETHIFPGENILDIENTLNQVNISCNNSIDKYQSIFFYYTDEVVLLSHKKELGASVVVFSKPDFSTDPVKLAMIYRKLSLL